MELLRVDPLHRVGRGNREQRVGVVIRPKMRFVVVPQASFAPRQSVQAAGEKAVPRIGEVTPSGVLPVELIAEPEQMPIPREAEHVRRADHPVQGIAVVRRRCRGVLQEILRLPAAQERGEVARIFHESTEHCDTVAVKEGRIVEEEVVISVLGAELERAVRHNAAIEPGQASQMVLDVKKVEIVVDDV